MQISSDMDTNNTTNNTTPQTAPNIAASRVAVPEVTTEQSEIDKKSVAQFLLSFTGRSFEIFSSIILNDS